MQQSVTILCNLTGAKFCHLSCQEGLGNEILGAYKFCAIIHSFISACRIDEQYIQDFGDYCTSDTLNFPLPSVCPPQQPHIPKSCFCTVWRKPTTRSRCSSLTRGCHLCPTTQKSKFRCASVRRTGCTAAPLTPTAPAFSCCLRHSCSPYSVSIITQQHTRFIL